MENELEVSVNLTNEKVQFIAATGSNPAIAIDYTPPIGDGQGYMPLELLLISLASCSGSTVVTLLRKMRKNVATLTVHSKGIRRDQHPLSFSKIILQFVISSSDVVESDMNKAIKLSEETYCPVWAMLSNNVEVIPEFRIITSNQKG